MKTIGIIPSRYASSRFPGKPLTIIHGKTMIQRVYEQAKKSAKLTDVIVATDDERIFNEVKRFGGTVAMTASHHKNGTERCAEVVEQLIKGAIEFDTIINIQGDEPFIDPAQIDLLTETLSADGVQIATLVRPFSNEEEKQNPSRVKAFVDEQMNAIIFSRSPESSFTQGKNFTLYKHIGLYGFRKDILLKVVQLPESPLEKKESLEQLRWMENGYTIKCAYTEHESISIDTPEDLKQIEGETI